MIFFYSEIYFKNDLFKLINLLKNTKFKIQ